MVLFLLPFAALWRPSFLQAIHNRRPPNDHPIHRHCDFFVFVGPKRLNFRHHYPLQSDCRRSNPIIRCNSSSNKNHNNNNKWRKNDKLFRKFSIWKPLEKDQLSLERFTYSKLFTQTFLIVFLLVFFTVRHGLHSFQFLSLMWIQILILRILFGKQTKQKTSKH